MLNRLKDGVLAALAGWLAGFLATVPLKVIFAWRYVDGHVALLPEALAKGLASWGAFCLFMAVVGFVPFVLPLILLISPAWMVRRRWILIPLAPLLATAAINKRMGFLSPYYLRHPEYAWAFLTTAPNIFVVVFGLAVIWVYILLAQRRL